VLDNALLEIANIQRRINQLATEAIAFGPGKIRPSILILLQVTTDLSPEIHQI